MSDLISVHVHLSFGTGVRSFRHVSLSLQLTGSINPGVIHAKKNAMICRQTVNELHLLQRAHALIPFTLPHVSCKDSPFMPTLALIACYP